MFEISHFFQEFYYYFPSKIKSKKDFSLKCMICFLKMNQQVTLSSLKFFGKLVTLSIFSQALIRGILY